MKRKREYLMVLMLFISFLFLYLFLMDDNNSTEYPGTSTRSTAQDRQVPTADNVKAEDVLEPLTGGKRESEAVESKDLLNPIADASFVRVEAFLSQQFYKYPSFVESKLTKEDLPLIYQYLEDFQRASHWSNLGYALSILEEEQKAFNYLTKYATEPWDWKQLNSPKIDSAAIIIQRVMVIGGLANFESEISGSYLQKGLSKEGAEELIGNWDGLLPPNRISSRILVKSFKSSISMGMACSENPEYVNALEEAWNSVVNIPTEGQSSDENEALFRYAEALGWREYISEMGGIEEAYREYVRLTWDDREQLRLKYQVRYLE